MDGAVDEERDDDGAADEEEDEGGTNLTSDGPPATGAAALDGTVTECIWNALKPLSRPMKGRSGIASEPMSCNWTGAAFGTARDDAEVCTLHREKCRWGWRGIKKLCQSGGKHPQCWNKDGKRIACGTSEGGFMFLTSNRNEKLMR